jgi:hypothetical protein
MLDDKTSNDLMMIHLNRPKLRGFQPQKAVHTRLSKPKHPHSRIRRILAQRKRQITVKKKLRST